ncbi:MAG: helix-turn-helix domain-containing protein, partial [Oscillospiraceae bacterium]
RTVLDIACQFGYDNASKFSACFKERYGVTPSQYRTDAKAKQSIGTKTE